MVSWCNNKHTWCICNSVHPYLTYRITLVCACEGHQFIFSNSSTVSLRSSTTASTSSLVVLLPTLNLKALTATSVGTPQFRRMWEGLIDRHNAVQGSYVIANKMVLEQKQESFFYLFPLSEWQAAPTLANSLLQLDNTLQPKAGEREINHSKPL